MQVFMICQNLKVKNFQKFFVTLIFKNIKSRFIMHSLNAYIGTRGSAGTAQRSFGFHLAPSSSTNIPALCNKGTESFAAVFLGIAGIQIIKQTYCSRCGHSTLLQSQIIRIM